MYIIGSLCLIVSISTHANQPGTFPTPRFYVLPIPSQWNLAPIVTIGYLENVSVEGIQNVSGDEFWNPHRISKLYWCGGNFRQRLSVRGDVRHTRFVWASVRQDCPIRPEAPKRVDDSYVQLWFMREESNTLRPLSDGARFYLGVDLTDSVSEPDTRRRIGEALKKDIERIRDPKVTESELFAVADIICNFVGRADCILWMQGVAKRLPDKESASICRFLAVEYSAPCRKE
jgi:hypothetical protein